MRANQLLELLLTNRGLEKDLEIERFLHPAYERDLHDPFLLPDMDKAVARIREAISANQKIIIFGDYDADGIPGGVVLHDFFKKIGYENFENYIPHRHDEGFGLNIDAVKGFAEKQAKLVITIDCGITDYEEVAAAKGAGIDVIITDHHVPHGTLPEAFAIVDPKMPGSVYPFEDLCGAAVAFKLVTALITKGGFNFPEGHEKWLLDMVGLATLSDMVPLTGENRMLAHFGLKVLRKSPRPGLAKLFSKMKIRQNLLSEDDITFMLAPRINAASRMSHPVEAFNMLAERRDDLASVYAERLCELNDERKHVTASILTSVRARFSGKEIRSVIVVGDASWKPGVLGLVAGSLADEYRRPVFVWGREGGLLIKGSARSGDDTDLVGLMEHAQHLFTDFGGHKLSGGFSISHEKIDYLDDILNEGYAHIKGDQLGGVDTGNVSNTKKSFEAELTPEDITEETLKTIEMLAPFGVGNPKPIFLIKNAKILSVRQFGKGQAHTEFVIEGIPQPISAIAFFKKPEDFPNFVAGERADILCSIERSYWGTSRVRLRLVDETRR